MDSARKARDIRTPVKMAPKTLRMQGSRLLAKIESMCLSEDQEVTPVFLKRPETEEMLAELPSSDEVLLIVEQIRLHKLKKTDEFVKKFEHLEGVINEIESINLENKDAVISGLTNALRAGVGLC
jgi:hypothetical protein